MRQLIVCNIVSLDGYFEGPGGDVMALPFEEAFDDYNAARLRAAGTLLLGRRTYEGLKSYWPPVAGDAGARPVLREISRLNDAIGKVVVSDTLTPEQTAPWHNTRIVTRAEARKSVAELKNGPQEGDILMFGSHVLWNDLLAGGLVDELHLMIGAGVLGGGTPAFTGRPPHGLRLLGAAPLPGSSLILARYAPASARP
ncbi:dihydrofolate reductase family protein [Nonomuraea sp. 3N208]|uniref:dihydrofolate reductase family protein n=1 Tax=Nonomuraea sp. 3N208 TaxID=3457421 RepID=UPI003FD57B52